MGLFGNEVRREFIARPDAAKGQILYKWPDTNIRKLTQLTVEQDEQAVFFRDGQVQGTVNPGRSTLDSSEIPRQARRRGQRRQPLQDRALLRFHARIP